MVEQNTDIIKFCFLFLFSDSTWISKGKWQQVTWNSRRISPATGSYWKPWLRENSLSSNNYLTICSFRQGDVGNQGNLNAFCFLHFFHDLRFKNEKIRIIESSHGTINSPNKHFTDNLYYFKGIHHTWTRKASIWSYPNHSNRPVSS